MSANVVFRNKLSFPLEKIEGIFGNTDLGIDPHFFSCLKSYFSFNFYFLSNFSSSNFSYRRTRYNYFSNQLMQMSELEYSCKNLLLSLMSIAVF